MKIAVIVHVFYPELWPILVHCIRSIGDEKDVFVSCSAEDVALTVARDFPAAKVVVAENRGYDVWPFLKILNRLDLGQYSHIVKLHTKRTICHPHQMHGYDMRGTIWRELLLSFVDTPEDWAKSRDLILSDATVGMVSHPRCILRRRDMGRSERKSFDRAVAMARELLGGTVDYRRAEYVAGTIFLIRADLLAPLQGHFKVEDFEPADVNRTETLAHVLERLFGMCVAAKGLRIADPDDSRNSLRTRWQLWSHEFLAALRDFLFQSKITRKGHHVIKICKIPIWHGRGEIRYNMSCHDR